MLLSRVMFLLPIVDTGFIREIGLALQTVFAWFVNNRDLGYVGVSRIS